MSTPGPSSHGTEQVPTADELQRAITSVTGVVAAEVTRASNGRDRLRISLAPGEDPEAVAWSVAATLRERFGIALDPAAISARAIADQSDDPVRVISRVAPPPHPQADGGWPPPPPVDGSAGDQPPAAPPGASDGNGSSEPPVRSAPVPQDLVAAAHAAVADETVTATRRRAAISELLAQPIGDDLDVAASLRLSGREVVGRARGVPTRRGRWRAISEATIDALGSLSADRVRGHVDHVTVLTFADLAHVSVSVTLLTEHGEETFLGAALVRDDPDRAVMRATLDAVNRRVEPWLAAAADEVSEAG